MMIRLGGENFPVGRYRTMQRFGDKLVVCFADPPDTRTITGPADVDAAVAEVLFALGEVEREQMGTGWQGDDDE